MHMVWAGLVIVLTLAFAGSTLWVPDFGGFDPQAFPVAQVDPPVQPKGYAFAIWGVIYLWLLVSALFGFWKRRDDADWHRMRPALCASLAVGAIWLPVAVLSPIWATLLIWAMLIPALIALFRAPHGDAWAAAWPIGLYAGWLSAASCVAIGLLLGGFGVLSEDLAAILMILVAAVLAYVLQSRLARAPTYGIAAIWALVAIFVQNGLASTPGLLALIAGFVLILPTLQAARGL
ncbi:MAG: hypothetical protein AAGK30_08580 [Pseudomonadota bacterium]